MIRIAFLTTFALALATSGGQAMAQAARAALLIGNAVYSEEGMSLVNPENDVDALAPVLRDLGFEVAIARNATAGDMRSALAQFQQAATGADVALVFFAGHGVQLGEQNLLIGSDLNALTVQAAQDASITLSDITEVLDAAAPRSAVVLIDACRDNPLMETGGAETGLAVPRRRAGTLIAYATDPGNVAFDGLGQNSTFTEALLRHIATPGLDIRIMLGRVRQQVVRETSGAQVPWVEESVLGELVLLPGEAEASAQDELAAWRRIQNQDRVQSYRTYLDNWPEGLFSQIARNRIAELEQGGATPSEGTVFSVVELPESDLATAAAALELAGFMPGRGLEAQLPERENVLRAFEQWAAARDAGEADVDILLQEGARLAVFLGTYAAGILRKDLQNFAAVEETLLIAERDMAVAREMFADDPSATATLSAMEIDVAQTRAIRNDFARRLDDSRDYYHTLISTVREHFSDRISMDLVPRHGASRTSVVVPTRALEDAQAFMRQVDLLTRAPAGSYLWLTDFLEGQG